MYYGKTIYKRRNDIVDRIGVRTLIIDASWQPSSSDLTQDQIDAETPDEPDYPSGVLPIGMQTLPFGGIYKTAWTFEGVRGDGKGVTFATRGKSYDYGFDPGMSQLPIQLHNLFFTELLPNFQGSPDPSGDGVIWPPYLSSGSSSGTGLGGGNASANNKTPNPMFGHQDFFSMEGTYRYRYASLTPPTTYTGIGMIAPTSALPGMPPQNLPDERNWLTIGPQYKRRGLIFDIVETYWLSQAGGWCEPIYNGKGTASGNGLNSGGFPARPGAGRGGGFNI